MYAPNCPHRKIEQWECVKKYSKSKNKDTWRSNRAGTQFYLLRKHDIETEERNGLQISKIE
jgi:hypothetical protein